MRRVQSLTARRLINLAVLIVLLSISVRLIVPTVYAVPPLVTSALDNVAVDGACTLREAINTANGAVSPDCAAGQNITFAPAVTNIQINAPLPPLNVDGIIINGGGDVVIRGDRAGASATGTGIQINSANNRITGLTIVEFPENGILITGDIATDNVIENNLIGMEAGIAAAALGNGDNGILIENGASANIIGPNNAIGNNCATTIADCAGVNIRGLGGAPGLETRQNRVIGNFIGLNENGNAARPNQLDGVAVTQGARNNRIGGNGDGNTISGNLQNGVFLTDAIDTTVSFNTIGPNFPNDDGIVVSNASVDSNIMNNTVNNNNGVGIEIRELGTTNNTVRNNTIRNNTLDGVNISNQATNNIIGPNNIIRNNTLNGVLVDAGGTDNNIVRRNTIQNNGLAGVAVGADPLDIAVNNRLTQNAIFNNGGLGIDLALDGVTANDGGDGDIGPNLFQNFPILQAAVDNAVEIVVIGTLDAQAAQQPFRIEFFQPDVNAVGVPGEAQTYLAAGSVNPSLTTIILGRLPLGSTTRVTATAISTTGNTSEFAANIAVEQLRAAFIAVPTTGVAPLNVQFTDQSTGSIGGRSWNFGDGSPVVNNVLNPNHTYNNPGTYTVTLTVTHSSGLVTATATQVITVLPPVQPPTDTPTNTLTNSPTPPLTATFTRTPTATITPSVTLTPSFTRTFTLTPSLTVTPSLTATRTPTFTLTPSLTNTLTFTPSLTVTPTNTITQSPTPLPTSTSTPLPTRTFTPAPSFTPIPSTPAPTFTLTLTPTRTPTPDPAIGITKVPVDDDTIDIIIENGGDEGDFIVEEELRPGVFYVSAQPGTPLCTENQGVITCSLGTLPSGASANVQITVNTQGVDITSGLTTVTSGNRTVSLDEPYIVKLSQPPFVAPGDTLTYTIRIINPTNRVFSGILMTDTMPDAVRILSAEASSGSVTVNGQNIRFTQASLAAGGRVTITVAAELLEGETLPQVINRACLTTSTNPTPRCAVAGFVRAAQLPGTGETPSSATWLLLFGGLATLTGLFGVYRLLRRGQLGQ